MRRLLAALSVVLVALCGLGAGAAFANSYTAMLAPNTTGAVAASTGSAGYVYWSDSWTAPLGLSFNGFAYTGASFYSAPGGSEGGVSAGFGGDGTANQPTLLFPFTDDCAIANGSHRWAHNDGGGGVASSGNSCYTSGATGGWNYNNSQILNVPGVGSTGSNYQTLWLTMFCQAAECSYSPSSGLGGAGVSVTNLSGQVADPWQTPSGAATWASSINPSAWYQTNNGAPALNLSANDPAGVCGLSATLNGPGGYGSPDYVAAPATTDPGSPIGNEFASDEPCGSGGASGTWTLPAGLQNGAYTIDVFASNPGNYEAQGMSQNGAPTVATYSNAIQVDDTTPTISWQNNSSQYTSSTSEDFDVTVGPSGLGSVVCSDNGTGVVPRLISGSTSGQGTSTWSVPTSQTGANQVSCTAANGDQNGELTGSSTHTFEVDDVTPTVIFADPGYNSGSWTGGSQNVAVSASTGPSGLEALSCSLDGGHLDALSAADQALVSGNGKHTLTCAAESNTQVNGTGTFNVWIDSEQPTSTFLVNGSAPPTSWLSGNPTVQVIGSEQGGLLSGLAKIVCTVTTNGQPDTGSPVTLSTANGGLVNNTGSFTLSTNGPNLISCVGTSNAGTVQAAPSTVTVNLDDPLIAPQGTASTVYGSAAEIDNGQEPYSNGPSETSWYHTAQPITITANAAAGAAPISSISCKGALTGSWPIDALDTDAAGGEQITVEVQPPGGELSCSATDSAGNAYPLGTYLFQIDDSAPTGHFVPQAQWPTPNEVEVSASDNGGSGIAYMHLYATNSAVDDGAPQDLGQMTYDSATGYYKALVPDGVAPFTSGRWTFTVNTSDVAGNTGQITAGPDGGPEQLDLPLLQDTQITATAGSVNATEDAVIPAAAAQVAGIDGGAPAAHDTRVAPLGVTDSRSTSRTTATVARARTSGVVTVAYGRPLNLRGALTNLGNGRRPVAGATVLIYEQITGAAGYSLLGSTDTDAAGRYAYQVPAGASRSIYVIYPGSSELRPASSDLRERSIGQVAMNVSTIRAGGTLVIRGRVKGGHIPDGGVNVTIDYRQAGAPGSGTLGTTRTNAKGDYRFSQPFAADTRGLVYIVWAVVQNEPGWPFLSARSPSYTRPVG
jgi:hypothetical protein